MHTRKPYLRTTAKRLRISVGNGVATTLLLAIATSGAVHAQQIDGATISPSSPTVVEGRFNATAPVPIASSVSAAEVNYRIVDSLINAFSFYTINQQPLVYDPQLNLLVMISRGNTVGEGDGDNLYIRTSTDLGMTWSPRIGPLHDPSSGGPARYPSVAIARNPGDPSQPIFLYNFPTFQGDSFGTFVSGIIDASGTPIIPPSPDGGVSTDAQWSSDSRIIVSKDNLAAAIVGSVGGNAIAQRRLDVMTGTFTTSIPEAWDGSRFAIPTEVDSRTSTVAGAGVDNNNVFYLGAWARFSADDSQGFPFPAVSVSTDQGVTWGEFDVMPLQVLLDYTGANMPEANPGNVTFVYSAEDFMVAGNGNGHFLANLYERDDTKPEGQTYAHIVEVTRGNSGWSMRKVSDISGRVFRHVSSDTMISSQMQNEVMLSMTADGSRLVAKWYDLASYTFEIDIDNDGDMPDTLTTSDIFYSTRLLGSGGRWMAAVNVTESPIIDKVTWVPDVVPNDLSNVPMVEIQTIIGPDATLADSLVNDQLIVDVPQYIMSFNVDLGSAAGVKEGAAYSRSGARLNGTIPNPVNERALITFQIPSAANVTLEVFSLTGEKLRTLQNGRMAPGNHGVALDANGLASGSYYYTLNVNGEPLTKMFTVVR